MHDPSSMKIPPLSLSDNLKFPSPLTGEGEGGGGKERVYS